MTREPARAEALSRRLVAILAAAGRAPAPAPEAAGLDEEARQRLAALGYLSRGGGGSSAPVFDRSKEDPKDLIAFFRSDQRLNELVEQKKYAEARALCDDMLRQRPGFADCHLQMSKIALAEGQKEAAYAAAKKAVALGPINERAHLQLAFLLRQRGDLDGSITHFRRALALGAASAEAHAHLGSALAARGTLDEAIAQFEEALGLQPDAAGVQEQLAAAHVNRGRALKQQGKLDEAVTHYRRAIAVYPRLAVAHNNLGSALGSQGHLDEAVREFQEALRLQPGYAEARNNLELAMRMIRDRDDASTRR